jgi:prepilin-type processing-associated H-X9-DG protein
MDETQATPDNFRFGLKGLLYAISVLCAGMATFGVAGIWPSAVAIGFWAYVFGRRNRFRAFLEASVLLLTLCGCGLCMTPAVSRAREAARRVQCMNNLKQIALALHNYHDQYGCLPPARILDADDRPMHSWRVLILPFLEQKALYDAYDFSEPWDGPNNRKLASPMPSVYACPSRYRDPDAAQPRTDYVVAVGEETVWRPGGSCTWGDVTDGVANTLMVLETGDDGVPWMAPEDVSFEEAMRMLNSDLSEQTHGHRNEDFFWVYSVGRNMAFCDGSVHFFWVTTGEDVARAILTTGGGETIPEDAGSPAYRDRRKHRKLRTGNVARLATFIFLVLLPLPWVKRKRS